MTKHHDIKIPNPAGGLFPLCREDASLTVSTLSCDLSESVQCWQVWLLAIWWWYLSTGGDKTSQHELMYKSIYLDFITLCSQYLHINISSRAVSNDYVCYWLICRLFSHLMVLIVAALISSLSLSLSCIIIIAHLSHRFGSRGYHISLH